MKAVIMAGGEGTRLRPLTVNQPKPMLPVANRPMAEHIITLLREHGFEEVVITVAFLANTVRQYFGDGSDYGVRISYAVEQSPLGTAGSVANARAELRERFLVISGDVITDIDLSALVAFHDKAGAVATIALKSVDNPLEFGIVITDAQGRIERFLEKPTWGQVFSDTINTGIYVLEPEVLDLVPSGASRDFSSEVLPELLEAGRPLYGWVTDRYWEDVGTLDAYLRAHADVLSGTVHLAVDGFPVRPGVHIGEGADVDPTAEVVGPALIGPNCRVSAGARLGAYSVLGANVRIGEGADLERCVVMDNCYVGPQVTARGAVLGRSCDLRLGVHLEEGVVLGDGCRVGRHAVVNAEVKIWPNKVVEPEATVASSLVWETRGTRALFGRIGVQGLANVDLSPELAVRVANAYASLLPKGSTVTTSRDSSRAARVLKRAAMVGLNAAGINVEDLEVATVPLTRFHVRTGQSQGGVTVRLDPSDPQSVVIRFLDADGIDVDEATQRKIERLFDREESRRVVAAEIGDTEFPARTAELYTAALVASVDAAAVRSARFKLVLDYAYGAAGLVMPSVLGKLGAEVLVVNPLVSTVGVLGFERFAHAARIGELVRSSGAHLGAVIGPDGEILTLADDRGRVLDDDRALLALVQLVAESEPGSRLAVPVNTTWAVNELCAELGAEVIWAKLTGPHVLDVASTESAVFAASAEGGYAFPRFLPAYDAVAALVHLLALLARREDRLSELVDRLPSSHVVHDSVPTPFEQKGTVMRVLSERARGEDVVLVDGVKTIDVDGWTLVLPDPTLPSTHVYAEGPDDAASWERAAAAAAAIRAIVG